MDFYLQFGYGMMEHSRVLVDEWGGGTVILSPRDLEPNQLVSLAEDIHELGGEVLLDPQFYLPDASHHRLASHDYWPDEYASDEFWQEDTGDYPRLIAELHGLNSQLETAATILPGIHTEDLDSDWYHRQSLLQATARDLHEDDRLLATVSLSDEPLRDRETVQELLEVSADWPVDGFYLLCEHPPNEYLVSNPVWLHRMLDLVAGWRLRGQDVVVGYCNQQMLILACVAPTALASGTWKNVRSFPPDKFRDRDEDMRRSTWYYAPDALSEYQLAYLDIAHEQGVLQDLTPPDGMGGGYAEDLFAGPEPTAVGLSESPNAFRHYLLSLHQQVEQVQHDSFDETFEAVSTVVEQAGNLTSRLRAMGVRGGDREFSSDVHAATESALTLVRQNRGPMLAHHWQSFT